MAAKVSTWTPDLKPKVLDALRTSRTLAEAQAKLGISRGSMTHAVQTYGISPREELLGTQRDNWPTPEVPASASAGAVSSELPPWTGYKPKPGWKPPEEPARASPVSVPVHRTVVVSDVHVPYQDRSAWACALGIIRDLGPDRVVVNGDFLDLESLSRHPKSRPDLAKLAEEFYAGNVALDSLQAAAGSAEVVFLEGNHCARARRFEAEFGQLDGLLSVPVGLYMEPRESYRKQADNLRGIRWVPLRDQPFALGAVSYLHGVFESLHHAYQTAMHLGPRTSTDVLVTGHMHAFQSSSSPSGHASYACPWLGDPSAPVFSYTKGRPRPWSHGVLVIEESAGQVTVTQVPIRNGRAVYAGRVVLAA